MRVLLFITKNITKYSLVQFRFKFIINIIDILFIYIYFNLYKYIYKNINNFSLELRVL